MADLKDRVIVLIGTGSAVDRGVAEGLAEAGATLYLARPEAAASGDDAAELEGALSDLGGAARVVALDPGSEESLKRLFRRVEAESGRLDVLVSLRALCADRAAQGPFWEEALISWDRHGAALTRGMLAASALGARFMVPAGRGLIVQVLPGAMETNAGVLMAGLAAMTRQMARAVEGSGVGALVLDPGAGFPLAEGTKKATEATPPSPRLLGRCLAALAMDPDVLDKSGGCARLTDLKGEYRFAELGEDP